MGSHSITCHPAEVTCPPSVCGVVLVQVATQCSPPIRGEPKSKVTSSSPLFCQILIDLQFFFTERFFAKFAVIFFYIGEYLAEQERGCLVHFLQLLAVWWPGAQSTGDATPFSLVTLRNILRF